MVTLEKIKKMELLYKEETFETNEAFEVILGELPVLVSAPHSVTHFRKGQPKHGEFMTGVIAKLLQERLNCYCITKTKNDLTDPNFDGDHPYKEAITNLVAEQGISFLIDLHIMASERPAAIEIGTGNGRNVFNDYRYEEILKQNFELQGINPIIVNELFTGGFKHTVSSTISREANIPCIQIEINWRLLNSLSDQHQIYEVLDSLTSSIDTLRSRK
ncbi:N-formylglutamate amidohydrolase [Pseudoneobacillus rhizosphaerae]|uniref:N-formylglutamate amidohydrolase n=1 Tax=Pseudoneobacillus rhizosphaerae TaxID=2880968 RepID=A0A9C7GAV4_9BACI|nr:N-formylglutamate amidohydrolase [Pseudoneobacillus rhizosphaerae]CAG9608798.1 hypothetical protein NEOCIP111885_02515 [Pseudoneobacillus rhizosphaerae]